MAQVLVVVSSSFPIDRDGSEAAGSFVADLVQEIAKQVPVCVVAPGVAASVEPLKGNIQIIRFAAPRKPLSTLRPWVPADLYWLFKVWRGGQIAVDQACERGAGHILAMWGLPCGEWARRAARKTGVDYSVWLLGSDVWSLGRLPVARGMLARVIRHARNSWADGYALAAEAQRIGGTKIKFLPSSRNIDTVNPPLPRALPPYRFLFLGRWHPNKGIDLLLDALAMLDDEDWLRIEKVEIQGGGPMHALVHARVEQLRTAGRPVEVGGFLAKVDAEAAIVRADWVLLPSRVESIPVVFSDAMKLGRRVIATPVGDLPRLLKRGCGILCSAVTANAVTQSLQAALEGTNGRDADQMAEQASIFSLESVARQIQVDARLDDG